jgi:Ca2+-binding RTX toxin-like protein
MSLASQSRSAAGGRLSPTDQIDQARIDAIGSGASSAPPLGLEADGAAGEPAWASLIGSGAAPVLALPIPDRDGVKNETFNFRLPDGTFTDADSSLTYKARLAGGGGALPAWLTFDPVSHIFQGTPPQDFTGGLDITVIASDGTSSARDTFHLQIRDANDVPTAQPVANQTISEDQPWVFQLPAGTFADADSTGLLYRASQAGGLALPSWIHFDSLTQTFSGAPPAEFNGAISLVVEANDGSRANSVTFELTVTPVPDTPVVAQPLQDRWALEDAAVSFVLPDGAFTDPDGDQLTLSAIRANGSALPAWLSFDAATGAFTGTPPKNFTGALNIKVSASDGTHVTSDTFVLKVLPVDDAPTLANATGPVHITAGSAFVYHLPTTTFTDADDATLTYTAMLVDGSKLPNWLHFKAASQTFTGTAPAGFAGPVTVMVAASDGVTSATETFAFTDTAPVAALAIADQTVGEALSWTFAVPDGTFKDFDTPLLSYSASLANGEPLPTWLSFDPSTQTFAGTPPSDWSGHEDLKVTASDGTSSSSDTFALNQNGDFSYHILGSVWGRSAPSEIHYRFDQAYFESHENFSAGFSEGFSSGPLFGGISGSAGIGWDIQAGLLVDFTLKPDQFELTASFDINVTYSDAQTGINTSPFISITGEWESYSFHMSTPSDAFMAHAFAGITATVTAMLAGGIYGGLEIPDIPTPFGDIDIPDLTFDASFSQSVTLPGIQKITIADGKFTKPDGDIGAIDATVKTGDAPFEVNLDEAGIGHLTIGPPTGISTDGFELTDVLGNGLGTLSGGGTSDPFFSATLDLDKLAIKAVPELEALFHAQLHYDLGGFFVGANIDTDLALTGDLSLSENVYFTPHIHYDMTTSFGQHVFGEGDGSRAKFQVPEGEGSVAVDGTYTSYAEVYTVISLKANVHFDMSLLKAVLVAGVGEGPISFDFANIDLPAVFAHTFGLFSVSIPIYTNVDVYSADQSRADHFVLPYERFRTVFGSGDSFTLTTHQIIANGNDNANVLTGNALDNVISGFGGNDVLKGGPGADSLDGGDGSNRLLGGDGLNTLIGGAGRDVITSGDDGSSIDGGGGNDVITTGSGDDVIVDLLGVVRITDAGGNNTITVGDQRNDISLLNGNNTLVSGSGNDTLITGAGNDVIRTGDGANFADAGEGTNSIIAGGGNDTIVMGAGDDYAKAYSGRDLINVGEGNNYVLGMDGNDTINAGAGADTIDTGIGDNVVNAGDGANSIYALDGKDVITTGSGADTINANGGDDLISTGAGNDFVLAGDGRNTITGGLGSDTIGGGAHNDTFIYGGVAESTGSGYDEIFGFDARHDLLDLDVAVTGIEHMRSGDLSSNAFNHDLHVILGAARLAAGHAVVVEATGELAGRVYLVVDANGVAGYQADQDYVLWLDTPNLTHFGLADFI